MIVRCFSCTTRFLIDPQQLGEEGRTVRCGKCGYSWLQLPAEIPVAHDVTKVSLEPVAGKLPQVLKKPVPKTLWYLAATAWLLLIIGLAFLFGFRQQMISAWAPVSRLYQLVGIDPPVIGEGLVLSNIASRTYAEDGAKPMVVITGQVVNPSPEEKPLPVLALELRDGQKRILAAWNVQLPAKNIGAGEAIDFLTQQPIDNALVSNVLVQFAGRE